MTAPAGPARAADIVDRFTTAVRGVCPVLEVPFHPDESVDEESFANLVDHILATGVTSVMFAGFASEFHKLADDERAALRDILLDRARSRPDVVVVASVAEDAGYLARQRAVAAVERGAGAVNLLAPFRVSPSADALRRHIGDVADAVAPVPVILQHAPAQTGVPLSPAEIGALARAHPNIRMIKVESVPPGTLISALRDGDPSLPSMVGYGGVMMIDALRRGAVGVQPGCSVTELYVRIWQLWTAGEQEAASDLHRRMLPYLSYWMQHVDLIVQAEKTISVRRGLIRHDICRAPGRRLDAQELRDIDRFLAEFADLLRP